MPSSLNDTVAEPSVCKSGGQEKANTFVSGHFFWIFHRTWKAVTVCRSLLCGSLLPQRCRTDDLLPSIPISCLPPCRIDPKVLRLNILINCSQPGGSWSSNGSPPVCWWS